MVRSGTWAQEDAPRRARETFDNLLPHGLHTADHYLYTLVAEEEAQPVGLLWFALIRRGPRPEAFIYDIRVDAAFRRRGYATQALQALEERARALGGERIGLHVFAHNKAARALYEKLGYRVTSLWMAKETPPEGDIERPA